jgi:hypothetical protein
MSTKTRAERADVEPREPRCRICRRSDVRRLVNDLLGWRGVPVILEGGNKRRRHLHGHPRQLEPLNEGRDKRTGSPMTASGSTPSVTTTLPG